VSFGAFLWRKWTWTRGWNRVSLNWRSC
jgi:hypothetical protein